MDHFNNFLVNLRNDSSLFLHLLEFNQERLEKNFEVIFKFSLLVIIDVVDIFYFHQRRNISNDLGDLAESISINHIGYFLIKQLQELRIGFFPYLGIL
jgi:hypothetical protein